MEILGIKMNLRLVFAMVVGATVFAAAADSSTVVPTPDKKSVSVAKKSKEPDPAIKKRWETEKRQSDAMRAEGKRHDFAEMDAKFGEMRNRWPRRESPATAKGKGGAPQKTAGKNSQHKSATAKSARLTYEKHAKLIEKEEADWKVKDAKEKEQMRKLRQDSGNRGKSLSAAREAKENGVEPGDRVLPAKKIQK